MGEFVFGVVRHLVSLGKGQPRVDVQLHVGLQPVAHPAHPHLTNRLHAKPFGQHLICGRDQLWVDAVAESR